MSDWAGASVFITHDIGLHARPSVKLTKLAKGFTSKVEIALAESGPWIDAKSIVKVMAMKAKQGTLLHVRASGEDAGRAVVDITGLVARDFDEAGGGHGAG